MSVRPALALSTAPESASTRRPAGIGTASPARSDEAVAAGEVDVGTGVRRSSVYAAAIAVVTAIAASTEVRRRVMERARNHRHASSPTFTLSGKTGVYLTQLDYLSGGSAESGRMRTWKSR